MDKFRCIQCNFTTNDKTKHRRHLNTKKHLNIATIFSKPKVNLSKVNVCMNLHNEPGDVHIAVLKPYNCKHCGKLFSYKQSRYKHMKDVCKEVIWDNDEKQDWIKLVELLND